MGAERIPATEQANAATRDLDRLATSELVAAIVGENARALAAAQSANASIARAVDAIAARLRAGGRLHYVGAGTSGRLGVLDASECPPTFGTPPELVQAHIAGGSAALVRAVEGAEDDAEAGASEMRAAVGAADAVVGLSASGGAPYVVAALAAAREIGAVTIAIANDPESALVRAADLSIVLETGPEVLGGSTRLKAGTAQKLVLNALSTAVMVQLGKVYGNLMVDVAATNEKLRRRAVRLVQTLLDCDAAAAREALRLAGGSVKVAVVAGRCKLDPESARRRLAAASGSLREALGESRPAPQGGPENASQ
jgi:N-acetylmuramic acid 6-phosphate etherase